MHARWLLLPRRCRVRYPIILLCRFHMSAEFDVGRRARVSDRHVLRVDRHDGGHGMRCVHMRGLWCILFAAVALISGLRVSHNRWSTHFFFETEKGKSSLVLLLSPRTLIPVPLSLLQVCDAGSYCASVAATAAVQCTNGAYCPPGSISAAGAGLCDGGFYCPAGASSATQVPCRLRQS